MTEETKLHLETEGFHQMIQGITRSWRGQQDSAIDHIWTTVPEIIISTLNKSKPPSDHHIIGATIRVKGLVGASQEFYCRDRKNFNLERFKQKLISSQWEDLYAFTDLDRANNWFEENLRNILQEECPVKITQPNKKLKNWIKPETKNKIKERDSAKTKAQQSDTDDDWASYKANQEPSNKYDKK